MVLVLVIFSEVVHKCAIFMWSPCVKYYLSWGKVGLGTWQSLDHLNLARPSPSCVCRWFIPSIDGYTIRCVSQSNDNHTPLPPLLTKSRAYLKNVSQCLSKMSRPSKHPRSNVLHQSYKSFQNKHVNYDYMVFRNSMLLYISLSIQRSITYLYYYCIPSPDIGS